MISYVKQCDSTLIMNPVYIDQSCVSPMIIKTCLFLRSSMILYIEKHIQYVYLKHFL